MFNRRKQRLQLSGSHGSTQYFQEASSFRTYIADIIDLSRYSLALRRWRMRDAETPDVQFDDNEGFWTAALEGRLFNGSRIELRDFQLAEWLPLSPGRYFTREGRVSRHRARGHFDERNDEFIPLGKLGMILGGLGTCRLTMKKMGDRQTYILCATANGICHQGIPIIIERGVADRAFSTISERGGVRASISGQLSILPIGESPLVYDLQIPRYYIVADEITLRARKEKPDLLATVAVLYSDSRLSSDEVSGKVWSFASFDPARGAVGVQATVDWLMGYGLRYGARGKDSSIVCDFDETTAWFPTNVELPLRQLLLGIANQEKIRLYAKECNFRAKTRYFLSYRRADSVSVDPIYRTLADRLGHRHVFIDRESIPLGDDFRDVLRRNIEDSDAIIALIGSGWRGLPKDGASRIEDPNDWVRKEIEWGMELKKRIIPVILDDARDQLDELPSSIASLRTLNSLNVRPGSYWSGDVDKLVASVLI